MAQAKAGAKAKDRQSGEASLVASGAPPEVQSGAVSKSASDQKDKNYWAVLEAVIRLEVNKGHLLWKVTDVARLSGVGRPLIYYYFGKSKEEIVQAALKIIGDEFFGLSDERLALWREGRLDESIKRTRALIKKAPYVPVFYFHWRYKEGEIAEHLQGLEKRYRQKLAKAFPERSSAEHEALFSVLFGLIMLPDLGDEGLQIVLQRLGLKK